MSDFIVTVYVYSAFVGAFLLIHVIRQAMDDLHLRRTDPPWVINARNIAFVTDAAFLFLTVCFQEYWLINPSLISVGIVTTGLVVGGIAILAVNVISLRLRAPPTNQPGLRAAQGKSWRKTIL